MKTLVYIGPNHEASILASDYAEEMNLKFQRISASGKFEHLKILTASMAIFWNGAYSNASNFKRLCVAQRVPHVIMENGLLPQSSSFLLDFGGIDGDSDLNNPCPWVTDADMEALELKRMQLQEQYPLRPEGWVLAPMQVDRDTAVIYHSRCVSMADWIHELALLYPHQEVVIRPHPKSDADLPVMGKHQRLEDEPADILEHASRASAVVGLTSTCLIETAILGVPTFAFGDCPLRTHTREHQDRVLAAYLARRVERTGRLKPYLDRMGIFPR